MSDLAATNCGGCNGCGDCGCGNNIIWLIILLLLFDGNGYGCGNGCGNNNCIWLICLLCYVLRYVMH
ncbi:MAG: chorion class high-cysteine HCB protein 13 [Lachnospira pectinoschiza]